MSGSDSQYKLHGYTVIVTRPAEQADKLSAMIESAGGRALRFPLSRIADPVDIARCRQQLTTLSSYDLLIFVSVNAVTRALRLLTPQTIDSHIKIAAIGPSTAAMLQKHNYDAWAPTEPSADSESFLEGALLKNVRHKRIAIIRGDAGRELIAGTLEKRGATVDYIEVYRRLKPSADPGILLNALAESDSLRISITSNQGLYNLMELIDEEHKAALLKTPLIVLSKRNQSLAATLGFKNTFIAKQSNDHGIMEALQRSVKQ